MVGVGVGWGGGRGTVDQRFQVKVKAGIYEPGIPPRHSRSLLPLTIAEAK